MRFRILFSQAARAALSVLEADPSQGVRLKKVRKAIGLLELNPRHPGPNTHRYQSKRGPDGEPMWEAYVENQAPRAWRIWFMYGPGAETLSIIAMGPRPD